MLAAKKPGLSEADYLLGERLAATRHEYRDGAARAMAGESKLHNKIAFQSRLLVHTALQGRPCDAYMENVKTRVAATKAYYYPDVVVTCDPRDTGPEGDDYFIEHPSLIIEVLSPTTETIDRGEKLAAYKTLPSLYAYLLVSQQSRQVELYRRGEGKLWLYQDFGEGETVEIPALDLVFSVDDFYAGTGVT